MKISKLKKNGFTILYAVLISSLLLAIGLGIYNILIKDLILSASASQSQIAIFAADTGVECAMYWDLKGNGGAGEFNVPNQPTVSAETAPCGRTTDIHNSNWTEVANKDSSGNTISITTTFSFYIPNDSRVSVCSLVSITKSPNAVKLNTVDTVVDSRGYNTCDPTDPRRVERGLRVTY